MIRLSNDIPRIPEFAHYYGDWIWDEELTGWIKSLLLFFDGIALALPTNEADQLIESSPVLAQPLAERGLLRNYPVDQWLLPYLEWGRRHEADFKLIGEKSEQLREIMTQSDLQDVRALIDYIRNRLSVMEHIAAALDEAGIQFGADTIDATPKITSSEREYEGRASSLMRALRIAMISKLLCRSVTDITIEPVINDGDAASLLAPIIGSHDAGRAKIVIGDLAQIGVDLGPVPLDEVLDFRSQHGSEYRSYSNEVRKFVLELSLMGETDRNRSLVDRRAELDDSAEQLRKLGRTAFARQTISFGFGLAGAAWTLVHGDPWGAAFATAAASAGLTKQDPEPIGASYTYILRAKTELRR